MKYLVVCEQEKILIFYPEKYSKMICKSTYKIILA